MTELRRRLLGDWPLKAVAVVFAVALWAFVVTEERTDAVFTVPLDLIDRPPGLEVASSCASRGGTAACAASTRRTSGPR